MPNVRVNISFQDSLLAEVDAEALLEKLNWPGDR